MGVILCATRGGEESYRTQDKAISLAKARGDTIYFFYVVDLEFLNKTSAPLVVDVEDELDDLGEFLLLMARERAAKQDLETNTICRHGNFREQLIKTAIDIDASLILLGRPAGEESAFKLSNLRAFAADIEAQTGVETLIV